jgi:hypothetical protein
MKDNFYPYHLFDSFGVPTKVVTKEIIEFFLNNDNKDSYEFQSSLDINNIEEFINNCN